MSAFIPAHTHAPDTHRRLLVANRTVITKMEKKTINLDFDGNFGIFVVRGSGDARVFS